MEIIQDLNYGTMKNTFTITLLLISAMIYAQDCSPFTATQDLIQGNLKQTILRGNDGMLNPLYIKSGIGPKGDLDSRTYAPLMRSSNIWAGGLTPSGNIKLAAGQYDQQDWTPGPLDVDGITSANICSAWNRIWTVTKEEIIEARSIFNNNGNCENIPANILNWPGRNNPNLSLPLIESAKAEFWDENGDGIYDPCEGDVPLVIAGGCHIFSFNETLSQIPGQISYYVMNDNGAPHFTSQASPLQMTVHVHSFTYKSQEAQGIIFHKYSILNQGFEDTRDLKFGAWLDFNVGCASNDKVGSVPKQNMVYAYNGEDDENCGDNSLSNSNTMVGYSFLSGPRGPFLVLEGNDGQDSLVAPPIGSGDFDTLISIGIENITIPNNCLVANSPLLCDPINDTDFYNLLNTRSFDGMPVNDIDGIPTKTMYDGNPADPSEWSSCNDFSQQENTAIMAFENILMQPQAYNQFYSATFYTEDTETGCPDVASIKYQQRRAQKIYNNCFHNFNGPPAPNLRVLYSDDGNGVTLNLFDIPTEYVEAVPQSFNQMFTDLQYRFEGVKVYQVACKNFDMTEINNPLMSTLVYQGDITNDIIDITNFRSDFIDADQTWIEDTKVTGANNGIDTELSFTYDYIRDQPIDQSDELYYVALSYGYNNYDEFDPIGWIDDDGTPQETGQQYRYIETTCGLKTVESVISVSSTSSPNESGVYDYIYNDNIINLFNIEEDLSLQLLTIDGKSLELWNAKKGDHFTSRNLAEQLASGLYILNVTVTYSGLNSSHKLVVTQ